MSVAPPLGTHKGRQMTKRELTRSEQKVDNELATMIPSPQVDTSFWMPASWFQWVLSVLMTISTGFVGLLWWVFRRHLSEDDLREANTLKRFDDRQEEIAAQFNLQEALIERRHAENIAAREASRAEVSRGNEQLMAQMIAMRREIVDVLLDRRNGK